MRHRQTDRQIETENDRFNSVLVHLYIERQIERKTETETETERRQTDRQIDTDFKMYEGQRKQQMKRSKTSIYYALNIKDFFFEPMETFDKKNTDYDPRENILLLL